LTNATEQKPKLRAAQYLFCATHCVRVSSEDQRPPLQNQADKIKEYAEAHGMEIVRTYSEKGKIGSSNSGRASLKKLVADIEAGDVDFNVILVYDVSRWGRLQGMDESAYYERIFRRTGIQVVYCAEQFENDGLPIATIVKSVKRLMAGYR